ncbi:nicotinamide-nucleotide amidohydrolase family protein [Altererythrobacter aerius]|uniref:Nicotinamide-nucleotide amidohydrolase family protein n=1 Tax=Tsuneonella aeria TaxID=1837929 RepID=A0A6I4TI75_9SPHN|nr:CinA family protein [Tsuneonella aeria]MXO76198.1 nicotinamide-nucleotide amidohydrolase family protein [Tsuneonella aeria]
MSDRQGKSGEPQAEALHEALPNALEDRACAVLDAAHDRELTIATAESCTGGLLAALLTDVRGRGHVFDRGFVTYCDAAKASMLGIDPDLIEDKGAVSREVALEMAKGALAHSDAHISLSITGFAGPGGPDDEEGLVHFACAVRDDGEPAHREEHFGAIGRGGVRIAALEVALAMVEDALRT